MKCIRTLLCLLFASLVIAPAHANDPTVIFSNIQLSPTQTITSNYSFGPYTIIFCYANNTPTNSTIVWPYHGSIQSAALPTTLVINSNYTGELADPSGKLAVRNNQSDNIIVSCYYS